MAKVTVIFTSFNHEKYIQEAIDSVLNQTFTDYELIILDDNSVDKSWELINQYSDSRIKAIRNDRQRRAIWGINKAISEFASGEYIAIHHSDDVWEHNKLEKQVAYLDAHSEIGAVFTLAQIIDENGARIESNCWFEQENKSRWQWLQQLFLEQNHLCHPSILIKKQCYIDVGLYRYGLAQTGDAEMWSRLLIHFPIHVIQERLTKHRIFSDKSNTSGIKPVVEIRISNEWNVVRENFLLITEFENIVTTFPCLERFRNPHGYNNKFLLAMACLYESNLTNAWQLGLKWLFDLINDQNLSEIIEQLYSFSYIDFIKLTGELDVYRVHAVKNITITNDWLNEQRLAWESLDIDRNNQIEHLTQAMADRDEQIKHLAQAMADRDEQIKHLAQAMVDRDSKITFLNQALEIINSSLDWKNQEEKKLHHVVEELKHTKAEITEILSSTSWRLTGPLRLIGRYLRRGKKPSDSIAAINRSEILISIDENGIAEAQKEKTKCADTNFDAEFYHNAYPHSHGLDPYFHYSRYGKNEGLLPCAPDPTELYDLKNLNQSKETILIISHEASRSGAPILALNIADHFKKKYNVVAFLIQGGALLADFQKHCDLVFAPSPKSYNPFIASIILEKLISNAKLKFAIVNSIVSGFVLPILSDHFIPSLCLIHEFASYTPKKSICEAVLWASQVVFSARIVFENNAIQCDALKRFDPVILPQGKCKVSCSCNNESIETYQKQIIQKVFCPDSIPNNTVIILGAGSVQLRKGVDLFLACAAKVVAHRPTKAFRFIWVGQGFDPEFDFVYSVYLQDQIARSELENHVFFIDEILNIGTAYELADVFFLSSRLDPLPNVAIDAMFYQLPVICFDNATGIADILKENGLGEICVVPYLDVEQAAKHIVKLIEEPSIRKIIGKQVKEFGELFFNMKLYVESLEQKALNCVALEETEERDCLLIEEDGALNYEYYLTPDRAVFSYKKAVRAFVRAWKTGVALRKPFPGFQPGIYEYYHNLSETGRNPLAAYIQAGKPEGPWLCDIIKPSSFLQMKNKQPLHTALHIHLLFTDLFPSILEKLKELESNLDLLITVPNLEVANQVSLLVEGYRNGVVDIRILPNRCVIGPFNTEFRETILKNYDVIGHIHTQNCGDVLESTDRQTLMKFVLENLIGFQYPMLSTILDTIAKKEKLGLVFPDYPDIIRWHENNLIAKKIAHQCDLNDLPNHSYNYPVYNMFWAKVEALKPLLTKNFKWKDYLEDPTLEDGSLLNTVGMVLPLVVEKMGYHVSVTYIPGLKRSSE